MTIDSIHFSVKGLILSTGLEEWFENAVAVMEVIVNNVDQETSFHELINQLFRWGILFVEIGPLCSEFKRLVLDSILKFEKKRSRVCVDYSLSKP